MLNSSNIRAIRQHLIAIACACCAFALAASPSFAGDLTPEQNKWLGQAVASLKKAETNLRLAQGGLPSGNKPLTGSRLKLALSRLESAKSPLSQAAALLAKLPADNDTVKQYQAQYDKLKSVADELETRMTGQAPTDTSAQEQRVKLDYRQEEMLKNSQFNLRDLEGKVAALDKIVAEVKGVEDKRLVNYRTVSQAMQLIEDSNRRAGQVHGQLDPLPADGRGVQPTRERLGKAVDSVATSKSYLTPIHEQLSAIINPASYPELKADTTRLSELSRMYANTQILITDRPQSAAVIKAAPDAVAERDRLVKKYALITHQQTDEGKRIVGISNGFTKNYLEFAAAAKKEQESLPAQIRADLKKIQELAEQAVAEQKPLFFTGGIVQNMEFAEDKLGLLEALDPEAAKTLKAEIESTKADMKKKQDSLRELIINANELPSDRYAGPDRKELDDMAIEVWHMQQPDAKVLMVRIPRETWKRSVRWEYSNGTWYKIDHSQVQANVIIKHNDKLAAIQPVNLRRNHLAGDELTGYPMRSGDEELQPHAFLLLEKVK